ncbi:outer membrane beta-barrel protein [Rhodospirillales bacterium]|nr:outer membrane beta-barrel protein [Rhodospirillales bacterium]
MGQIRRHMVAIITLAISAFLACIPLGTGALGTEIAARQSTKSIVTNVRVGAHTDKTRVVLDISKPTDLHYDVSDNGKAVFIQLPGIEWSASSFEPRHSKGSVLEFRYSPLASGGSFNILTDQPVSIAKPFMVEPGGGRGHRIVIDLIPSNLSNPVAKKEIFPREIIQNANFSTSNPALGSGEMIAGLANIGATSEDPPVIKVVLPNATREHKEVAQAQQNNPFLNPLIQERQSGFLGYQNIYFKGGAGINSLPEVVTTGSSGNDNTMEFDPGFALSGGIGVDLENDFRLEGEVIWASFNTLDQLVGTANGTQFNSTSTEGSISSLAFMANAAYDFSNQGSYIPFVYGGVGMAGVFMNDLKVEGTLIADSKDWVFAMQTGGGISVPIDPGTTLEASYRYFQTRDPEFGDERAQPFTSTLSSHSMMIGARLKF